MRDPLLFPVSAIGLAPKVPDSIVFLMVSPLGKDELA
jgi:hypothetical protein